MKKEKVKDVINHEFIQNAKMITIMFGSRQYDFTNIDEMLHWCGNNTVISIRWLHFTSKWVGIVIE